MDNHYHLLLETPQPNLSLGMRQLNGRYTQVYNRRHHRVGHLFQGRFKSVLVQKETHLVELCRYVVLNPVRAGMVAAPEEWLWSSYRATIGYVDAPRYLTVEWLLAHFGTTLPEARRRLRQFVMEEKVASPWQDLKAQVYLGSRAFVQGHQPNRRICEIPRIQTIAAPPALEQLFALQSNREEAIFEACRHHGYRLNQVAAFLGVHYATVSRALKKAERTMLHCKT